MMNISNLSTKFIFSSILFCTILISMSFVSTASAQSDSKTVTGTLLQMHGSLPDGTHITNYYLQNQNEDDTFEHSKISFDVVPSNIPALLGNKVIAEVLPQPLQATSSSQTSDSLLVHGIKLVDDGLPLQLASQAAANVGPKNIVTLMVKFPDGHTPIHSQSYIQDIFYDSPVGMSEFYRTSSYGKLVLSGYTTPWTTLPGTQQTYFGDLYSVAVAAIQANPQINWTTVDGVIVITNDCMEIFCSAWGTIGPWNVSTPSGVIPLSVSWIPDVSEWELGDLSGRIFISSHELGHNFEFNHTTVPPGNWNGGASYSYTDFWSVMGQYADNEGPAPIIMGQRNEAGWVPALNKVVVPRGSTDTITIDFQNEPLNGSNTKMVTLPLPDGTSYIIAAHKEGVFSDNPDDNEGIVMHRFYPNGNQFPIHQEPYLKYVLVATSGTENWVDFRTANLDVGETYTDSVNNVIVSTLSKTPTSVTVAISNNGPSLTPPTLTTVSIISNNTNPIQAVAGDLITLRFTADEPIQNVTATIASGTATVTNITDNAWEATKLMQSGDTVGTIAFTIDFENLAAIAGTQVTGTTNNSSVIFTVDITPPSLTTVSIISNNTNPIQAVAGDLITLRFTADEPIQNVMATIASGTATVTNTTGNTWEATRLMQSGDTVGTIAFTIDFEDTTANAGTQVTETTDESSVILTGSTTDPFFLTPWSNTVNVSDCLNSSLCSDAGQGQLAVSGNNVYVLFSATAPCNNEPIFCDGGGTDDYEVLIASSTDGGQTFGSPINISNSLLRSDIFGREPFSTTDSQIAAFGNNVIGVWKERDTMGDGGIFARISTDAGVSFGSRITIQDFGGAGPFNPIVAASSSGFFLAYEESAILPGIIFCKSSFSESFNCQRLAGSLEDDCDTPSSCTNPSITVSGENVYVTWETTSFGDLMIRVSNDGGSFFNPKINLSNFVTIDNGIDDYGITADGDNVYVVWSDLISSNVSFIASNNAGSSFGSLIPLTPGTFGNYPVVAASGNNVYVTYETDLGIGEFRRSTDSGANFDAAIQIGNELSSGSGWVGTAGERVFVVYGNGIYQSSIDNGVSFGPINPSPQLIGVVEGKNPVVVSDGNKIYILDDTGAFMFDALREVVLDVGDVSAVGPPSPPVITSPTDGAIITDLDPFITITGTAVLTATVEIFDGQTLIGTEPTWRGNWDYRKQFDDGIHSFTAIATDAAGNVSAASNVVNITVGTSITPPLLTAVSITSNNVNTAQAVAGDIVTLTFIADQTVQAVTATISDGTATVTNTADNTWTATKTMPAGDTVGVIEFTIDFQNLDGLAGVQVTSTTDGSSVTFSESVTISLPDRSYNNDLLSVYNARTDLQDFFPEAATGDFTRLYGWAWQSGIHEYPALLSQHEPMYSLLWIYQEYREDLQDVLPEAAFGADLMRLLEWVSLYGMGEHANILADDEAVYNILWMIQKFRPDLQAAFPEAVNGNDLSNVWGWAATSGIYEFDNILADDEPTIVAMWVYEEFKADLPDVFPELTGADGLYCFAANFADTRLTPHKSFYENNCVTTQTSGPTFSFGGTLESASFDIMASDSATSTYGKQGYSYGFRAVGTTPSEINSEKICGLSLCSEKMSTAEKIQLYLDQLFSERSATTQRSFGGVLGFDSSVSVIPSSDTTVD